jgi:hypothetical protein
MKALLVKYLPATNTQGTRLKLIVEGFKPIIQGRKYELESYEQAKQLMLEFCNKTTDGKVKWTLRGIGGLYNGDIVGTLETVGEVNHE